MFIRACFVLAFVVFFVTGCEGENARHDREWARLSFAVDQLRNADNQKKAAYLTRLEAEGCEKFCNFRAECVAAYRLHVEGLGALREAQASESSDALPDSVGELMLGAREILDQAREKTVACAALQGELSRASSR